MLMLVAAFLASAPARAATAQPGARVPSPQAAAGAQDGLDQYIRDEMRIRHIPGLVVGIARAGRLDIARAYGLADVEREVPVTVSTRFQAASITKTFTAVAVLRLVERRRVRLDRRIGEYLPGLPAAWRGATVEQLLRHTSGINSFTAHDSPPCGRPKAERDYRAGDVLAEVSCLPLDFAHGTDWSYSDTGYILLGLLVEARSGMDYMAFLRREIFDPLGMAATGALAEDGSAAGRATGYAWREGAYVPGPPLYPAIEYSTGGLVTTLADLARWDAALQPGVLLSAKSLRRLFTPTATTKASYGMGFGLRPVEGHPQIGHTGGGPAATTSLARFVDDGFTVIILANVSTPPATIQQIVGGVAKRVRAAAR